MQSLTSTLNEQIRRISRREITAKTQTVRRLATQHRRDIAAMKRQLAAIAKSVSFLEKQEKRRTVQLPPTQDLEGARFRADGLRSHRKKLGISAKDYGKLVGVSGLTVYMWESGKSRPRQRQMAKLVAVRGLGKREVIKRLEMLGA